ncbi:uncharacterized protein LOC143223532 [Tachypleus tridentatus]|uniref:uncharacterized protein LOC143223532 n=1 Tax=Tachypleus tridentatus TaxID=6853 RepID=UPI003FD2E6B2
MIMKNRAKTNMIRFQLFITFVSFFTFASCQIGNHAGYPTGPRVAIGYPHIHGGSVYKPVDYQQPQPYDFGYDITNDYSGNQFRKEKSDGYGNVQGVYGYRDPYGLYRIVRYTADGYGFRAEVDSNEPGLSNQNPAHVNIVAKAPPIIPQARGPVPVKPHGGPVIPRGRGIVANIPQQVAPLPLPPPPPPSQPVHPPVQRVLVRQPAFRPIPISRGHEHPLPYHPIPVHSNVQPSLVRFPGGRGGHYQSLSQNSHPLYTRIPQHLTQYAVSKEASNVKRQAHRS